MGIKVCPERNRHGEPPSFATLNQTCLKPTRPNRVTPSGTWYKLPAERPVSRLSRPVVQLSLVRAPAQPPQHAYFGRRSHTPASRCLRFERRVAATPARLAPVLLARLSTDQTCTGKLASASPIAPRIRLSDWFQPAAHGGGRVRCVLPKQWAMADAPSSTDRRPR